MQKYGLSLNFADHERWAKKSRHKRPFHFDCEKGYSHEKSNAPLVTELGKAHQVGYCN